MNIASHFFDSVADYPTNSAFETHKGKVSFEEMEQKVNAIANWLQSIGIQKEDKVLLVLPIGVEFYATVLAIFSIGARAVLIDQIKDKNAVQKAFERSNAKLTITNKMLYLIRWFLFSKVIRKSLSVPKKENIDSIKIESTKPNDIALITYTSGTTGTPKKAERSHAFLNHQLETLVDEMGISNETKHLSSLYVVSLCNLGSGATTIIHKKHKIPSTVQPNLISGSPYHVDQFLKHTGSSSLCKIVVGGSTIYPAFAKKLNQERSESNTIFAYGSTEVEPISVISIQDYLSRWSIQEIGIPVGEIHPAVELRIDPFHQENESTIGEILVRGDSVLYNHEHKTGDLGYIKDGCLYFVGRKKYCWVEDGKFYSPVQIEVLTNEVYPSATQLRIGEKNVLFTTLGVSKELLNQFAHLTHFRVDKFYYDKRHHSRINYEEIIKTFKSKTS